MEAHLEAVSSPTRLWWAKIGKWQALMAVTLIAFFVTLGITGNTKDALTAAFVITVVAVFTITFAAAAPTALAILAAALAALAAAVVAAAAAFTTTAFVITVVAALAIFAVTVAMDEIPRVSKKAIWLSYAGEFLLILLPMLWVLRG